MTELNGVVSEEEENLWPSLKLFSTTRNNKTTTVFTPHNFSAFNVIDIEGRVIKSVSSYKNYLQVQLFSQRQL
jgi:hypothetical protein